MVDRQDLGDRSAGRMSDDMGTLDPQRIHQADNVGRHPLDGIPDPRLIALPDAAMIERHDLEPLRKSRYLVLPKGCKPAESRDEQDREAHAVPLVIERAVAD